MTSTARDRFLATLRDGRGDCPPRHERLIREEVAEPWRHQGLPADVDLNQRFGIDKWQTGGVFGEPNIDLRARPPLPHVVRDRGDVADWYARFGPDDRRPADWSAQVVALQSRDWPVGVSVTRGLFQTFGVSDGHTLVDHLLFLADFGAEADAMVAHLASWTAGWVGRALDEVELDYLTFDEPVASQHAPVIGPRQFKRFVAPLYRAVADVARARGVEVLIWVTYGRTEPLVDQVLETGLNTLWLGHAAASGMDVRALRRRLGPTVGLIGGVDSRLLQGPVEAIPDQVARQLEPLLAGGRVAPMLDDRVRSITPLAAFEVYRTALGALLDQR